MYVRIYIYFIYIYMYMCVCVCIYIYIYMFVRIYIYIYKIFLLKKKILKDEFGTLCFRFIILCFTHISSFVIFFRRLIMCRAFCASSFYCEYYHTHTHTHTHTHIYIYIYIYTKP